MKADPVEAMIAGRDLCNGAVDGPRCNLPRPQLDDRVADELRVIDVPQPELHIVCPAVDAIDYHIAPLAQFVRKNFRHQPPDDAAIRCGVKDRVIADCAFDSCGLQLAVHDFDDAAPLTHPPQGRLEIRRDAPRSWRGLFRQARALQRS
jgi:hypothetical protein